MLRLITFKCPTGLVKKIDEIALKEGVTRSEILRRAIEAYIAMLEGGKCGSRV